MAGFYIILRAKNSYTFVMGLSENIFNALGVLEPCVPCAYKITLCGTLGVYIEGAQKIIDVNDEKVIFLVKNGKIVIEGKNLKLTSFVLGDASIKGEILKVQKL